MIVFLMEDANEKNITTNQTHLPTFNSNHTVEPTISPIKNEEILSSSRYDTTGGNITTNQSHSPTFNWNHSVDSMKENTTTNQNPSPAFEKNQTVHPTILRT